MSTEPSPNVELATATAVVRSAELIYTGLAGISAMLGLKYSIEASGKTVDLLQAKGEDIVPLIMEGQAKTQAWLEDHPTALANTTLVIQSGTDLLMAFREMAGLSAVEMGQVVASVSKSAQAVGLIQDRNRVTTPGNCTPQEHAELQAEVNRACKSQGPRSCSPQLTPAPIAANNISKAMACIAARQKINNMCFMGGNNEHKEAIGQEHALIARCLKSVNRP